MKKYGTCCWLLVLALVGCQAAGSSAEGPPAAGQGAVTPVKDITADQVVANYVKARGGRDRLAAVQTLRMTGKMTGGDLQGAPVTIEKKRPNLYRRHLDDLGVDDVQAFDGSRAWEVAPKRDVPKPALIPPGPAGPVRLASDFDGPLIDSRAKGNTVELVGKEKIGDKEAYKLRVKLKDGSVVLYSIDPASFLLVRIVEAVPGPQGRMRPGAIDYSDYREDGGVLWPHREELKVLNTRFGQQFVWDKIEINPKLDEAVFKMPAGARAAA
jgi:hypothetical protein